MMRYIPLISLASFATIAALVACGSLSDPAQVGSVAKTQANDGVAVTNISGSAPDGTHVAVVWRAADNRFYVSADAPVANGNFTLALVPPPSNYFVAGNPEHSKAADYTSPVSPPVVSTNPNTNGPLAVAEAVLIAYRDRNGNGVFDLDPMTSATSDTVVAASGILQYFVGGSSFDYEKLGAIGGPAVRAGYNLLVISPANTWIWSGLDNVALTTLGPDNYQILGVCDDFAQNFLDTMDAGKDRYQTAYPASQEEWAQISPDGGLLHCSADGYAFTFGYWVEPDCLAGPSGLCGDLSRIMFCKTSPKDPDAGLDAGASFPPGSLLPSNWPCDVDGGLYSDAGPRKYDYYGP